MKNTKLTLKIKDRDWEFRLISSTTFKKRHGDDCDAITIPADSTAEFDKNALDMGVVLHELGHVYYDCCNTESASLTADQCEEVFCTIMQNHFTDILRHAHTIMSAFTRQEI